MLLPLPLQNNIAGSGMARQLRKKSETGKMINRTDPLISWSGNQTTLKINGCILWGYTETEK